MNFLVLVMTSLALLLNILTTILNSYLLMAVFYLKKIQKKPEMSMVYLRFAVDALYCFTASVNLIYFLVRVISPDTVVKNLAFFIAWPTFNLGTIRIFLVFFITFDRVLATSIPIFYHKHRSKFPNFLLVFVIFLYFCFEQYILLGICDFVIDISDSCMHLGCAVNNCYSDYRLDFEQATRIALLDTFMIFTTNLLPSFLFTHFAVVTFENVGPLSTVSKNFGYVIEAVIICKVLLGKKDNIAHVSIIKRSGNGSIIS